MTIELEFVNGMWRGVAPWGTHTAKTWQEVYIVLCSKQPVST